MEKSCDAIKAYFDKTGISTEQYRKYELRLGEVSLFHDLFECDPFHAIVLLFDYGMAKGYRAAKAEIKKA